MGIKFNEVVFYKSVSLGAEQVLFDNKKEIVFVGRSNMGKSSLMNAIFEKKDLVKTSSTPGKTRLANIFTVGKKYYLTDLPGYGFAKLGRDFKEQLEGLISWYLEERKSSIKKVVMLIDSKLGAQESDLDMYKYILGLELPVTIVLSKIDKLSKNELMKSINHAKESFFGQEIIAVSSSKNIGILDLCKNIQAALIK
ncbi:MAG: ribosome biogenesis GTP-binding protein YihA/YsxC [Candidatus Gracilibacteria bacterium]|nr:ribosome biogenesis GTP-binding protein YihA/YsxC [Candidatus Gracilibacteria bacterium]